MRPDYFADWLTRMMPGWRVLVAIAGDNWRVYLHSLDKDRKLVVFDIPGAGNLEPLRLNQRMRGIAQALTEKPRVAEV